MPRESRGSKLDRTVAGEREEIIWALPNSCLMSAKYRLESERYV